MVDQTQNVGGGLAVIPSLQRCASSSCPKGTCERWGSPESEAVCFGFDHRGCPTSPNQTPCRLPPAWGLGMTEVDDIRFTAAELPFFEVLQVGVQGGTADAEVAGGLAAVAVMLVQCLLHDVQHMIVQVELVGRKTGCGQGIRWHFL